MAQVLRQAIHQGRLCGIAATALWAHVDRAIENTARDVLT
jgi:hypothetical protein